jgi:GNAT superfamily N-acetyltransferase
MAERTSLKQIRDAGKRKKAGTDIGVIGALADPQFREDVLRGLGETSARGVAGVLGAPVDLTTMALRPFGYSVPAEQVVGGSDYIGRQMERAGLISGERRPIAEMLGGIMTPDPLDVAKLGAMAVPVVGKALEGYKIKDTPLGKTYIGEKGSISIMENSPYAPRPNSITEFVVDEKERGKGVGKKILDDVFGQYPPESISASVSSPAALSMLYKKGFRPIASPSSSKEDAIKIMREDSAVTMVIPEGKKSAPRDEALRIAQANAAKPTSEGGLGLRPDNTAMERAQAMGFDVKTPLYHGTTKDIDRFLADRAIEKDSGWYGQGVYTTPDPVTASAYASWDENALGQNVIPMYARKENVFDYGEGQPITTPEESKQFTKMLSDLGYGSVEVPNKFADPKYQKNYETVLFDPSQLRSRFAAFDPARRYESDLLGSANPALLGAIATGTGAGLYGYNQRQKDKEKRSAK